MHTLAIAGVGLIGGSFAMAVRKAGFTGRILGVSSPTTLEKALSAGVIDEGVSLEQAAARADVLYLAQPIHTILDTVAALGKLIRRDDLLVTDAGSTKQAIVQRAASCLPFGIFLGGHPMAGKETRGVEASDPDLFRGRPYVLTPANEGKLSTPSSREFVSWVERIGAVPVVMTPEKHDCVVAFVSHVPQLASTALASMIANEFGDTVMAVPAGPGLSDMTRLALSPYEIWKDILDTNRSEISHALQVYIDKLTEFRDNLATSDLGREFQAAAATAARLRGK